MLDLKQTFLMILRQVVNGLYFDSHPHSVVVRLVSVRTRNRRVTLKPEFNTHTDLAWSSWGGNTAMSKESGPQVIQRGHVCGLPYECSLHTSKDGSIMNQGPRPLRQIPSCVPTKPPLSRLLPGSD